MIPTHSPNFNRPLDPVVRLSALMLIAMGYHFCRSYKEWRHADRSRNAFYIRDTVGSDCDNGAYLEINTVTERHNTYHTIGPDSLDVSSDMIELFNKPPDDDGTGLLACLHSLLASNGPPARL